MTDESSTPQSGLFSHVDIVESSDDAPTRNETVPPPVFSSAPRNEHPTR